MTYTGTVSTKGQITIPVEIRERLGLREGDRVEFVTEGSNTIIRPAPRKGDPFAKYVGAFAGLLPSTIEEIVREERIARGRLSDDGEEL